MRVRVQPRASRDAISGVRGAALSVRLTAPPVEGAANQALARLLAATFGVPPSAVRILRGEKGRDKLVRLQGIGARALVARLSGE